VHTLRKRCIEGITANDERCLELLKGSLGVVTALAPAIGYGAAAKVVKQAQETRKPVGQVLDEQGLMTAEEYNELLDPSKMLAPRKLPNRKAAEDK
jgi:aspartate ammonia-lyase